MTTIPAAAPTTTAPTTTAPTSDRTRRVRRIAAGASIIGAGVLTFAGFLTAPWEGGPTESDYLHSLTGHPGQAMLSMIVLHFGYLLLAPFAFVAARLARQRAVGRRAHRHLRPRHRPARPDGRRAAHRGRHVDRRLPGVAVLAGWVVSYEVHDMIRVCSDGALIAIGVVAVGVPRGILTMNEDADTVFAALRAGARGYLIKEDDSGDIVRAVRAVAGGEAVFGARIADKVLRFFSAAGAAAVTPFPQLTAREREVLSLVAQGCDNQTIARRLFLSDKTVRNHVSACLSKLQVASRAEAVALARDAGLGAPS
jgi:DNA-binding NarL/FixJ family response regulator